MILLRSVDVPDVGLTAIDEEYAPTGSGMGTLVLATAASISSVELEGKPRVSALSVECPVTGSTWTE